MNIDVRQGTLHGFELPDVVLAAVGAIDADGVSLEARAARRAPRATKSDEPAPVNAQLSGLETEAVEATASPVGELAFEDAKAPAEAPAEEKPAASARDAVAPLTPAMAAATVARSVTALRQAAEPGAATTETAAASTSGGAKPPMPPQRFAATFAKATTASREAAGAEAANAGAERASFSSGSRRNPIPARLVAEPKPAAKASGNASVSASDLRPHPRMRAAAFARPPSGKLSAPKLPRQRCVPRLNSTARVRRPSPIPSTPYMA